MFLKEDFLIEIDSISKEKSVAGAIAAVDNLFKKLSDSFHEISDNANTETGAIIARIIGDVIRGATTNAMTSARLAFKRDNS